MIECGNRKHGHAHACNLAAGHGGPWHMVLRADGYGVADRWRRKGN